MTAEGKAAVDARPVRIPWKSRSMASTARPILWSASAMISVVIFGHLRRRLMRPR